MISRHPAVLAISVLLCTQSLGSVTWDGVVLPPEQHDEWRLEIATRPETRVRVTERKLTDLPDGAQQRPSLDENCDDTAIHQVGKPLPTASELEQFTAHNAAPQPSQALRACRLATTGNSCGVKGIVIALESNSPGLAEWVARVRRNLVSSLYFSRVSVPALF
jgi:hypothetical protein